MGSITAQGISDQVGALLLDEEADRWPEPERLGYINEALMEMAGLKPDVSVETQNITLASGSRQDVPDGAVGIVDIPRNTGAYDRPIHVTARETLDRNLGDWHAMAQDPEVTCFCVDDRYPKRFFIFPPNDGTGQVDAVFFVLPAALTDLAETIPFDDSYASAIVDYVAYRCLMKDSDATPDAALAMTYWQRFYQRLGLKESVEYMSSPNHPNAWHNKGA